MEVAVTTYKAQHEHTLVFDALARISVCVIAAEWRTKLRTAALGH
jgi:hypothetical protein